MRKTAGMLLAAVVLCGATLAVLWFCAGCELEPASAASLTITPQTAKLREDQSQTFTASGGAEYHWSIDGASSTGRWAILSSPVGESIVYTSLNSPASGTHVTVLTVTSTLGVGTTNTPAPVVSAEAYITHVP